MKYFISIILSIFSYLIGGIDNMVISLLVLIGLDYITGVLKGMYEHKLSSKVSLKGIIKKIGYLLIVILATIFDRVIYDETFAIRALVIYFFIANEGISILENWNAIGLPLPKKIFEVFEKSRKIKKCKNLSLLFQKKCYYKQQHTDNNCMLERLIIGKE